MSARRDYTSKGTKKFQPQFDVLSDGWRQPGSSIKPIDYAIGIEDKAYTATTMFMDVVTDFGGGFPPTQADNLERGPVRLRSALQFSLNIPAIKATIISGLEHTFERTQDFGLCYPGTATPGHLDGHRHAGDAPDRHARRVRHDRQRRRPDAAPDDHLKVVDEDGKLVWPIGDEKPEGEEVISPQAAYIITDILAGNTKMKINPYWGEWAIYEDGVRRPAAYKTGTTSDNVDVHAYGYLAPPKDTDGPALAVGVWMGNSNNDPNKGSLSLDSSAPLWSAILEGQQIRRSPGSRHRTVSRPRPSTRSRASSPVPFTKKTVKELFLPGTVPTERETIRVALDDRRGLRPAVGGRLRRAEGAARLLRPLRGGEQLPGLAEGQPQLGRARGPGTWASRRPRGNPDVLLLQRRHSAVRAARGVRRSPRARSCPLAPPPECQSAIHP